MKILRNPTNGAEIKDLWIYDVFYLSKEKGETFKPGTVMQFEDKIGTYLKKLYGFLEELTLDEAKQYVEYMKKEFVCEYCEARFGEKIALIGHKRSHGDEKTATEAIPGIPIASGDKPEEEIKTVNPQQAIDSEASASGLEGEGLVIERMSKRPTF